MDVAAYLPAPFMQTGRSWIFCGGFDLASHSRCLLFITDYIDQSFYKAATCVVQEGIRKKTITESTESPCPCTKQ
jgi:hypothetical protein